MDTNLSRTDRTDLHVMEFPHWFHRSDHTHRVAAAILKHGPIARTTLAQDLGLSQGALSRITSDLIYDGVVEESSTNPTEPPSHASGAADRRPRCASVRTRAPSSASRSTRTWPPRLPSTRAVSSSHARTATRSQNRRLTSWLIPSPNW